MELAVYPAPGEPVDLDTLGLALNLGSDTRSYPATPEEAAWHGIKTPQTSQSTSGVHVTTEMGVSVGSRPDPATGKSEHGAGAWGGVGVDNRPQAAAPAMPSNPADDPYAVQARLRRMAFSSGRTDRPVAGYAYFPVSGKMPKNGAAGLEYSVSGERRELRLPLK